MRGADHGLAFLVRRRRQQGGDRTGAVLVLPGGRLVGDQQPPRTRERPGQGQALRFPGREPADALPEPLLVPDESERDGYVPDVVYSCGSLLHGGTVVLPYGCSDSSVRIATIDLAQLLAELTG